MSYISSNDNRFYAVLETQFGQMAALTNPSRFPAVKLTARQKTERANRKDKTGGRTFLGNPPGFRRSTSFELKTYMAGWTDTTKEPAHGPLFEAVLGGDAMLTTGAALGQSANGTRLAYAAPHGMQPGQAVSYENEIRFVETVVDAQTVQLNVPFSNAPAAGQSTLATATYTPDTNLKTATIFDYWSPSTSVQRMLSGAAINQLQVKVNGDYHEFTFNGEAADLVDSASFASGQAGLTQFPSEPQMGPYEYSVIPGHLGQVWLGSVPQQFFSLTDAEVILDNGVDLRAREFGSQLARGVAAGVRTVSVHFSIFQQDDTATKALYQAARQQSPMSVMFQLGQQSGQLFGLYLKSVVPEVPEFDDSDKRQQWKFQNCRAQGGFNDEIIVAFG